MENTESWKKILVLNVEEVIKLLNTWHLKEFIDLVSEKEVDGPKLLDLTADNMKSGNPQTEVSKLLEFVENLKHDPDKYINSNTLNILDVNIVHTEIIKNNITSVECQYQTVKKIKEENTEAFSDVEDILKRIVPAKSFLYRNQYKKVDKTGLSYVPMNPTTEKKTKRPFRLSYDYPFLRSRFSKQEMSNDRYYSMKSTNVEIEKEGNKSEYKTKYKSLSDVEELNNVFPEDHFYEDLCYTDLKENSFKNKKHNSLTQMRPCIVKLQEFFQTFKLPFVKKHNSTDTVEPGSAVQVYKDVPIYENADSGEMYDSVRVTNTIVLGNDVIDEVDKEQRTIRVEEYLEPIQVDYCDVFYKQKDDTLLGYIMSIFENLGFRRETNASIDSVECASIKTPPPEPIQKWNDTRKPNKTNMADRPLPVPVENEPYYMNIDRSEADNLLKGQPDGTFILRPSSQPNHAYTLSVSCSNAVHNVGVRRRPDGRVSLGYARRGEQSFTSVTSLLQHHRKKRLLLVASRSVIGATTLNETPHYYQSPTSLPITSN